MTNRERAERIWDDLSGRAGCGIDAWEPAIKTECLAMIAAQIDEAVTEALVAHFEGEDSPAAKIEFEAYVQGYAAAREQAAGIVDERLRQNEIATELQALPGNKFAKDVRAWMFDAAQCIRAMVPPGEVGK